MELTVAQASELASALAASIDHSAADQVQAERAEKCPFRHGEWYAVVEALFKANALPGHVHRILLYGLPGTGKTTCPVELFKSKGQEVESITMHQQLPPDDLIGSMKLVGQNGATVTEWADGPAIRAMRQGRPLVINEISKRSPECESALYNILDDLSVCSVTLPTGETVKPAPGFCVFGTMNDSPKVLPEAIQERFDIVLLCNTPAPGSLKQLPAGLANIVAREYKNKKGKRWIPEIGVRSITAAHRLSAVIGEVQAFYVKFGAMGVDILASAKAAEPISE